MDDPTKSATVSGASLTIIIDRRSGDIFKTMLLEAIEAIISYSERVVLKSVIKK